MFVCLFVCLFAVNAKTTARIDAKRSGITKNYTESVLCVLKSPVLVFLGRYRDISGFSFAADRHFLLISLPLLAVLRGLKSPVLVLSRRYRGISGFSVATDHHDAKSRLHIFQCMQSFAFLQFYEHCKCNYASNTHGQVHVHAGMAYKFNHDMHACLHVTTLNHIVTLWPWA